MRIEQARPDPEKAAKTQELHRKLRVWLSIIVWVVEYLKKEKKSLEKSVPTTMFTSYST